MSYLTLPDQKLSYFQWGNALKRALVNLTIPTPERTPADWWAWANLLISINALNYITLPSKTAYPNPEDWRKWAWMFIKNYNLTIT